MLFIDVIVGQRYKNKVSNANIVVESIVYDNFYEEELIEYKFVDNYSSRIMGNMKERISYFVSNYVLLPHSADEIKTLIDKLEL